MDGQEFINELDRARTSVRRHQAAVGALILLALLQSCSIVRQSGRERQYFVPPEIARPFWLAGPEASPEYFEELGQFVNGLPLNVTPETVDAACQAYLRYILPRDRGTFKARCDAEARRVKRDNAAESFSVRALRTDARRHLVELDGVHTTFIHDKQFRAPRTYRIEFDYADGRFYVRKHEQVGHHDASS